MGALRDFVADMLESEGAAVEPVEPEGLEVLAPEPLRAAMGWPEFARLGPTQSGACMPPSRRGHTACCSRFAIPRYLTKSATD
jgi:hypothetical protein